MINYAETRYKDVKDKIEQLKGVSVTSIPIEKWDEMYLVIKGTKAFFEEFMWDELLKILSTPSKEEDSLTEQELTDILADIYIARKDVAFREFYELMKIMDELKPLMKEG